MAHTEYYTLDFHRFATDSLHSIKVTSGGDEPITDLEAYLLDLLATLQTALTADTARLVRHITDQELVS